MWTPMSNGTFSRRADVLDVSPSDEELWRETYGYIPSLGLSVTFVTFFGLTTLIHTVQSLRFRTWFLLPTVCLCGALEAIGWACRVWSSLSPNSSVPFFIQSLLCILGPTAFLAANFVILGRIIDQIGPRYSLICPRWYTRLFVSCDMFSLLVQAAGGGLISSGLDLNYPNPRLASIGFKVIVAALSFQLVVIVIFALCGVDFILRYLQDRPWTFAVYAPRSSPPLDQTTFPTLLWGVAANTTFLTIRGVYRVIELSGGMNGKVMRVEWSFAVFDAMMVALALFTMNYAHPRNYLPKTRMNDRKLKGTNADPELALQDSQTSWLNLTR